MEIREARPDDAEVIAEFNLRLAEESEGLRLDARTVRLGVEALLKDPGKGTYYLAVHSGTVVGQLMITHEWSDWRNADIWWLQSVYVHPQFRRKGVFRSLFNWVSEKARLNGLVCGLRLYMHDENETALAAYKRLGMKMLHYAVLEQEIQANQAS